MPFKDPIVAGTTLVRPAIRSPNYVPGSTGWTINQDGTAEFNSITVRGQIQIGSPTGFEITSVVGGTGLPQASLAFWTHSTGTADQTETTPAAIGAVLSGGVPELEFQSPTTDNGRMLLALIGSRSTANAAASAVFTTNGATTTQQGIVLMSTDVQLQCTATASVGSGHCAVITGTPSGQRLEFDPQNVQSLNGGTISDLQLQGVGVAGPLWGRVLIPSTNTSWANAPLLVGPNNGTAIVVHSFGIDAGNNGTLNQPLYLNNNSSQGCASGTMRGVAARNTGSATVTSTTFAATLDAPVTLTIPPSGVILVNHSCIITYPGSSKDFYQDIQVINNTQGGIQTYGPSTNNGIYFNGGTTVIPTTGGLELHRAIMLGTSGAGSVGNPGDSITIHLNQMTSASGSIPISRVWLSALPSL